MPILAAEPSVFPPELLTQSAGSEAGSWWVLHTRPRQEKALARQLRAQEIGFFLPLVAKRSRIRGKIAVAHLPLFPGYVFLLGNREQLLQAYGTRRAVRHLDVNDQRQLWHDLRQVYRLIATGMPIRPELALVPGARVAITAGPLSGLRGIIQRTVSGSRFIVQVDFIQRGASVLIDDYMLECIRD